MKYVKYTCLSALILLTGCKTTDYSNSEYSSYCEEKPAVCLLIGAAIVGGAIAINNRNNNDSSTAAPAPPPHSDIRLKKNIRLVETLESGIRLHAYQYKGDNKYFVGVLAQELIEEPRFAHAVVAGDDGYFRVNYSALGLKLVSSDKMISAGEISAAGSIKVN